jgi:hypothetical protein
LLICVWHDGRPALGPPVASRRWPVRRVSDQHADSERYHSGCVGVVLHEPAKRIVSRRRCPLSLCAPSLAASTAFPSLTAPETWAAALSPLAFWPAMSSALWPATRNPSSRRPSVMDFPQI